MWPWVSKMKDQNSHIGVSEEFIKKNADIISKPLSIALAGPPDSLFYASSKYRNLFAMDASKGSDTFFFSLGIAENEYLAETKAYFEAVERYSVFWHLKDRKNMSKESEISTIGCAAHIDPHQAQMLALLEVVEKNDAIRHWMHSTNLFHIDLGTLPAIFEKWMYLIRESGYKVFIVDISSFHFVKTFQVILVNKDNNLPGAFITTASDVSSFYALHKALVDAVGSVLIFKKNEGREDFSNQASILSEKNKIYYWDPKNMKYLKDFIKPKKIVSWKGRILRTNKFKEEDLTLLKNELRKNKIRFHLERITPERLDPIEIYRCTSGDLLKPTFTSNNLDTSFKIVGRNKIPHPFG